MNAFEGTWYAHQQDGLWYVHGQLKQANGLQKTIKLHRWIMGLEDRTQQVDHVDNDPLNNRRNNLRVVTNAENGQNRKGAYRNNATSGVRGVSWHKDNKKWRVTVQVDGKRKHFGYFNDLEEAKLVAVEARRTNMPHNVE